MCSKLTIKIPERRHWRRSGIFIVNFEQVNSGWGTLRFHNFRYHLPNVCGHMFLVYSLLDASTSVPILFFKGDMTDIFRELLSIKETQTTLQNKETTVQSYRKISNQNAKKSPGIEVVLFICTG